MAESAERIEDASWPLQHHRQRFAAPCILLRRLCVWTDGALEMLPVFHAAASGEAPKLPQARFLSPCPRGACGQDVFHLGALSGKDSPDSIF